MDTTISVPVNFHRETHKTDFYAGTGVFGAEREWCHDCAEWLSSLTTSYPLTFGQNYSFTYREIPDEELSTEGNRTAWWGEFIGVKMSLDGTLSVYLRLGGHAGNEMGLPLSSLIKITPVA